MNKPETSGYIQHADDSTFERLDRDMAQAKAMMEQREAGDLFAFEIRKHNGRPHMFFDVGGDREPTLQEIAMWNQIKALSTPATTSEAPPTAQGVTGETSDGYHTFNELYEHRHALFIALAKAHPDKAWKSWEHDDGSLYEGWFIAGIETPEGQATYHLPARLWEAFKGEFQHRAPKWDGHTPDDVIKRIAALTHPREQQRVDEEEVDLDADYKAWLPSVCLHKPQKEADDLALCAWKEAARRYARQSSGRGDGDTNAIS